jgi:serine/threonine-protein kinase SRPK3
MQILRVLIPPLLSFAAYWVSQHLSDRIQSPFLRAPEVTIGAPWGTGVDIWSLGCLVSSLMRYS